jgi:hypothetical protein
MLSGDITSKARPPAFALLLWQPTQFCWMTPHELDAGVLACGVTVFVPTNVRQILSKAITMPRLTNLGLLTVHYFSGAVALSTFSKAEIGGK